MLISAELLAITAEDDKVKGYRVTELAKATATEILQVCQQYEAKAKVRELDLHRRVQKNQHVSVLGHVPAMISPAADG